MSLGLRADPTNTSAVISVAGTDQVVITNAGNVVATTFTGALAGNASTATKFTTTTGVAPVYGVRAWVQFSGTRNTSAVVDLSNTPRLIRGSGNVSSVVRNTVGSYTINFSTAMPDSTYCCIGTGQVTPGVSTFVIGVAVGGNLANSVEVYSINNNDTASGDIENINVAVIR